ncbi:hypothetical protein JCM11251_005302 [Rhodosporidiobolus azoricus]
MPLPELPPEILDMIFHEAFNSDGTPNGTTTNPVTTVFHRVREAADERDLFLWSTRAGSSWLPFIRSLLFLAPHVSTKKRADKLVASLRLAFPDDPASKGYLTRLVGRLSLDILERELPSEEDLTKKYRGADGVRPLQVVELAMVLPHLRSLVVSAADKGGWAGDPAMINALRRFKDLQHLEITSQGIGWQNALAIFAPLENLQTLKLKGCEPGWTFLSETTKSGATFASSFHPSVPYNLSRTLSTLVLWECTLLESDFVALFTSLAPASLLPPTAQPVGGRDAFPPPRLRHLTVHQLRVPFLASVGGPPTHPAFPPHLLTSHLSPLMPHLHSFCLTLFDRPVLTNNGQRNFLVATGDLSEGVLSRVDDSGHRPGNALAALIGPEMKDLTLGGPLCVSSPALYDALDRAAAESASSNEPGAKVRRLTLAQCADVGRAGDGLKPDEFVAALDREWASGLELVDVRGMEFALPTDENVPCWGEAALTALTEKAERISAERVRLGLKRLEVLVDEESIQAARRESAYRELKRKRTSSSGKSKKSSPKPKAGPGLSSKKRRKDA